MKYTLIFVVFIFAFFSCKKKENGSSDFITIGTISGSTVNSYQTTLSGSAGHSAYLEIDVNNDGTNDFRIQSDVSGSLATGQHPVSMITCIHDKAELFGEQINDTTFKHVDSVFTPGGPANVSTVVTTTFSCQRMFPSDPKSNVVLDAFHMLPLAKGDHLHRSGYYKSDSKVLMQEAECYSPNSYTLSNDTAYYNSTCDDYTCSNFPASQEVYIGVRLTHTTPNQIGWIHIRIENIKDVTVIESAINSH